MGGGLLRAPEDGFKTREYLASLKRMMPSPFNPQRPGRAAFDGGRMYQLRRLRGDRRPSRCMPTRSGSQFEVHCPTLLKKQGVTARRKLLTGAEDRTLPSTAARNMQNRMPSMTNK